MEGRENGRKGEEFDVIKVGKQLQQPSRGDRHPNGTKLLHPPTHTNTTEKTTATTSRLCIQTDAGVGREAGKGGKQDADQQRVWRRRIPCTTKKRKNRQDEDFKRASTLSIGNHGYKKVGVGRYTASGMDIAG